MKRAILTRPFSVLRLVEMSLNLSQTKIHTFMTHFHSNFTEQYFELLFWVQIFLKCV